MQGRKTAAVGNRLVKRRTRVDSESGGEEETHEPSGKDQALNGNGNHNAEGNADVISDGKAGIYVVVGAPNWCARAHLGSLPVSPPTKRVKLEKPPSKGKTSAGLSSAP